MVLIIHRTLFLLFVAEVALCCPQLVTTGTTCYFTSAVFLQDANMEELVEHLHLKPQTNDKMYNSSEKQREREGKAAFNP